MTDEQILRYADEVFDEAVEMRRYLHENPEPGNKEYKTSAYIKERLKRWGIDVIPMPGTAVLGVLSCGEGETVALRADMDALPVNEETGLSYSSKTEGMMHACGHDVHTASLLAAARVLSEHKDELHGTVKFIFEPDEEGFGGAKRMIKAGALEAPEVSKVFGIHIRPELEAGKVAVKYGKSYAASDVFEITVHGKSAHGAQPENANNALMAACAVSQALGYLASKAVSPTDSVVLSVCTFESGTACNIIPDRAVLGGIIRTLGAKTRQLMKKALCETAENAAQSYGCTAEVKIHESYPGVVNNDREVSFVEGCARELFGNDNVQVLSEPTMTTEDFGYFLDECDGCFYHVGAGSAYPLHNGKMIPDETAIKIATAMHIKTVTGICGKE